MTMTPNHALQRTRRGRRGCNRGVPCAGSLSLGRSGRANVFTKAFQLIMLTTVLAATSDLALVRMHGHSDKWDSKDIYERFGYRYSDGELAEWAPRIRGLAGDADITHVLFNNCYRNYAQVNAQQLAADLHGNDDERPGTLPASGTSAERSISAA